MAKYVLTITNSMTGDVDKRTGNGMMNGAKLYNAAVDFYVKDLGMPAVKTRRIPGNGRVQVGHVEIKIQYR
ncbi:hypothetical protein GS433_18840 [Rhodococcus hoagii]|uniref:hypothetical protein n=1 Tax=Rhodococcus hoagii TaxID=43767 RepID=UPI0007CD6829|nr:hypothetical protein [Prescottella equi]MBM4536450.1 hypothetical protein [Prescottella equi]NKR85495.1 hypothetical protein [Prescottella equi]ORJ95019.1 hypothetical protein A6F56_19000 [Prescottella equi]ORL06733.1 hypothetical protein A6I84_17260 [Prescottella equi]ORL73770.1 hypothetical protein A5N75_17860 [Prescottella equi]